MRILLGYIILSLVALAPYSVSAQEEERTEPTTEEKIKTQTEQDTYRQLNLFGDVFERVRSQYVEPMTDEDLIENCLLYTSPSPRDRG